jgi:hypothetical protein
VKKFSFLFLFLLSVTAWAVETDELPPMPPGPLVLTSITPEQLSPDYWINRLPNPDQPLKTPEELAQLNEENHEMIKDLVDIFEMELKRRGGPIRDQIELEYNTVKGRILFGSDDQLIPKSLFEQQIKPLLQLEKIPGQIPMRWGVATRATSVRALPSDVKMLEEIGDYEFDQLQFTLIKLWTPVGIYHTSRDGQWYYLQAPYVRGWVRSRDIALFSDREELRRYARPERPLVVLGESVPVFHDPELQRVSQRASMGTTLPIAGSSGNGYQVWMPRRGADGSVLLQKGYLHAKSDVRVGFPPFTQRNIIQQAFKLLGARYGWGGQYNGRDCSGFVHDVYLSMGVDMPRDSRDQAFVGTQLGHFEPMRQAEEKAGAILGGAPGITLMRMPLHMMIYIGEINGQFYVIHSTWAERYSMTSDAKRRINQVVVSDLTLNGRSYLGSLFDRIVSVNEVN